MGRPGPEGQGNHREEDDTRQDSLPRTCFDQMILVFHMLIVCILVNCLISRFETTALQRSHGTVLNSARGYARDSKIRVERKKDKQNPSAVSVLKRRPS